MKVVKGSTFPNKSFPSVTVSQVIATWPKSGFSVMDCTAFFFANDNCWFVKKN